MKRRDPQDERRDERLAGSSLASLLLHLLAAAFLVSIAAASSQESSTQTTYGGTLTIAQQVTQAVTPRPVASQAPAHRVAPAQRPPQHPLRHPRVALHELTQIVPSAPPNPTPIPAFTPQPLPVPTLNVAFARPTIAPTARPTPEPTAKPVPTQRPTARPQPTAKPVPSAAPTAKPVAVRTTAPQPTAAATPHVAPSPVARPSLAPSNTSGVPSPHPVIAQHRTTGLASPGPPSRSLGHRNAPQRPISIAPTPSPIPTERPRPAPTRNPYAGLNARLNALLPHGPVNPHEGHYVGTLSLAGRLVPTPPPAVLALTRYIFEGTAGGGDGTIRMWVTSVTRRGPLLLCHGWILHFPASIGQGILTAPGVPVGPVNGIQIGSQHAVPSGFAAGMAPIVVGMGTSECTERSLTRFTPPASPP